MFKSQLVLILVMVTLLACGHDTFNVIELPTRDAELYPLSQSQGDIVVAIDKLSNPERAKRYFGANLIDSDILPVDVLVSNHSEHRYTIKPADTLLRNRNEVIDPLPVEMVANIVKNQSDYTDETRKQIEDYYFNIVLQETVLFPQDNYQGVLFFPVPQKRKRNLFFRSTPLFADGRLKLHLLVTNLDTGERKRFGPFRLSPYR